MLRRRRARKARSSSSKLACYILCCLILLTALDIYVAARPLLRLQQYLYPLQALLIGRINPRVPQGYRVVSLPPGVHNMLLEFLSSASQSRQYSGGQSDRREMGGIEDYIIYGQTTVYPLPFLLVQQVRDAMKPLLEAFCECELQGDAAVYGVRVYHPGAYLVPHLDWPDRWVVSATVNLRHNASVGWPLTLQEGGWFGSFRPPTATVVHSPGDAVLYEGSRLWHGRPQPLQEGDYAGLFLGFIPEAYPSQMGFVTQAIVNGVRFVKRRLQL